MSDRSQYIAFLDESGDHSLTKIDKDFPVFVLCLVVVDRESYAGETIPTISRLKLRYWDHEGIILHSSDIRKARGDFSILLNENVRVAFLGELESLMRDLSYTVFIAAIRKEALIEQYFHPESPYTLSLKFILERLLHFGKRYKIDQIPIVAESRGKKEDGDLERYFYRLISVGSGYHTKEEFQALNPTLTFRNKRENIAGLQIADLVAHPCARRIINRRQPNRAYKIVQEHRYRKGWSWKVFP